MPLWVSVILAFAGMVYFPIFWEATALFLVSDVLYGVSEMKFNGIVFISFFTFLAALVLVELLKKKLKFYK
ncbi:MAG: hypothetical protein WAV15_04115 [Minisyncoccia bacterium]